MFRMSSHVPIICSIQQICEGNHNGKYTIINIGAKEKRISHALIGGKIISVKADQLILDEAGFKCKIKNYDSLPKGRFIPTRGSYCIAVIKDAYSVGKMVTANAVKVMESNNFQEFQNYREEAHQTSEFFS